MTREEISGFEATMDNDRRWQIETPEFSGIISEYNDELTGFDNRFKRFAPDIFVYGGNAYYILGALAEQMGWKVSRIERPRP